jgi:hypothetical protein
MLCSFSRDINFKFIPKSLSRNNLYPVKLVAVVNLVKDGNGIGSGGRGDVGQDSPIIGGQVRARQYGVCQPCDRIKGELKDAASCGDGC